VRIFQEFERLPRQTGDAEEGLGLGLAIVKRYAELLDVELKLHSVEGRGTCFSVCVPLGQPVQGATTVEAHPQQSLAGTAVVCLDNDAQIRRGMSALLQSLGADVTAVSSGWALRELLQGGARPSIVLADYHLDDEENGVDAVCDAQRDYGCHTPCIVISADNSIEVRDRVSAAGFRFLPKPVQPARLQALITALLENEKHQQAATGERRHQ
jgi:CheY-like chemotaxis protein